MTRRAIPVPPGAKSLGINMEAIDALLAAGRDPARPARPGLAGGAAGGPEDVGVRRNKYRNVRTEYNGVAYDSKGEAAHARYLDSRIDGGEILWWHPKPGTFHLGCPENSMRPDFLVVGRDGTWIEEYKGKRTSKFEHDVKLWKAYGPCDMRVYSGRKFELIEGGGKP